MKAECACSFILQFFSLSPPSPLCLCPRFHLLFLQLSSSVILSMTSSCWLPVTWRQAGCVVRVERCDFRHLNIHQIQTLSLQVQFNTSGTSSVLCDNEKRCTLPGLHVILTHRLKIWVHTQMMWQFFSGSSLLLSKRDNTVIILWNFQTKIGKLTSGLKI